MRNKGDQLWSEEDINYLRENYRRIPVKIISKDIKRSENAIKVKAYVLGISTDYKGENNPNWADKGGEKRVGYSGVHKWVRRYKLKPRLYERCKRNEPYDLANISGEYKRDVSDFEWLCRSCHMKVDGRLKNLKQYNEK